MLNRDTGEVLIQGKDYILLELKEGEFINVKILDIEWLIFSIEADEIPMSEPFISMKDSKGNSIMAHSTVLFHQVTEIAESKGFPFFGRITYKGIVELKNESKHPKACLSYKDYDLVTL